MLREGSFSFIDVITFLSFYKDYECLGFAWKLAIMLIAQSKLVFSDYAE